MDLSSEAVPVLTPPTVDFDALHSYRLNRVLAEMAAQEIELLVLVNPVSLRYVAEWREYSLFQAHITTYYLYVRADGRLTMHGAYSTDHSEIDEFRPAHYLSCFDGGLDSSERAGLFAADVAAATSGPSARVAVEPIGAEAVAALLDRGLVVRDAEPLMERARAIKSPEELICIQHSIAVAEAGMAAMRCSMRPGITENELFGILHQVNIANDGEWIDGRMLCSGPRTNPWFQQAGARTLEAGDLVAFDTDMIGPFGCCADISRTWFVGDGKPTTRQRDVYRRAIEEISHNAALLEPGRTFAELTAKSFRQPDEFVANAYACIYHGVGLTDEWPKVYHRSLWDRFGYDGTIETGMVLSVESYVGSVHGGPGVKLEDMYLIEAGGPRRLSTYPFEKVLS